METSREGTVFAVPTGDFLAGLNKLGNALKERGAEVMLACNQSPEACEKFAQALIVVLATLVKWLTVNFDKWTGEAILDRWLDGAVEGWSYPGPVTTGTAKLPLEFINFPGETLDNLEAVKASCDALGYQLVSAQAIAAYEKKYPRPDGEKKLIFFAGSEFRDPLGDSRVAYLRWRGTRWIRRFGWSTRGFLGRCWFAVVRKSGVEAATK